MDATNLLTIINQLVTAREASGGGDNGQTMMIVGMIINAALLVMNTTFTFLARNDSAKTKEEAAKTAEAVQKIEVHTNGERSATLKVIDELRAERLIISSENATLKEQQRGSDVAKEIASGIAQEKAKTV